jgi:general secretion pathway protein G
MNTPAFFHRTGTRRASSRGFTLMEMLIVLSIIALLMGMVIFQITNMTAGSNGTKAKADLLAFKEMLASYQLDNGSLPTTEQGLKVLWARPTVEPIPTRWHALLQEETLDPWGHHYQYRNPGKHNPDSYDVFSMGEDGQPDTADDIGNWSDTKSDSSH